jgi:tRNA-specific 2-thiouridylase
MRAPVPARVTAGEGGSAEVELADAEEAIAPGQACVFYKGSRVLGGGWIAQTQAALAAAE